MTQIPTLQRPTPTRPIGGKLKIVPVPKPKQVRALRVPADPGRLQVTSVNPNQDALRSMLDADLLEAIFPIASDVIWHAYVDDEAVLKGLPVNVRATRLARTLGYPAIGVLSGPVVFLGSDIHGHEADVPPAVIASAQGLGYMR